jgi:glyoxylase-like metal-dependent hydrolase (beta-lactamase superfamily II)
MNTMHTATTASAPTLLDRRSLLAGGVLASAAALWPSTAREAQARQAAAPAASGSARFHRFTVGSVECVALSDGSVTLDAIQPTFAASAPKEALHAALDRAYHPRTKALLEFNCIAMKLGMDWILIDAGYGEGGAPRFGSVQANLRAAGIDPDAIKAIFITHAHGDHINGMLRKDGSLAFPKAKAMMSKIEHDFWTGSPDLSQVGFSEDQKREMAASAARHIQAISRGAGGLELIDENARPFSQLRFIATPGHTPGHTSLLLSDGGEELFILGDAAHNHVVMFAEPSWGPVFDTEPSVAATTRATLWDRLATDRTRVMAFHLPWPGLGHVRRCAPSQGAAFEWVIAPMGL